ncbi:MAG: tetratricopeptide repeat protein, partial [Opitutales bacterium]
MLKAIIKHGLRFLLLTTLLGLFGCSEPEENLEQRLEQARDLAAEGQNDAALARLEELAADYPNDAEILHAIGRIHLSEEDATTAAFFLEQAHQQKPQDVELLYQTYQALVAADQPAGRMLEQLARLSPDTMTDELWIRLGEHRTDKNQTESALQAYLKGADLKNRRPGPGTAATIGQLFKRLDNTTQAKRWFEAAANSDDPNAMTALFGLLEIQLSEKQWADAEETIERLDKQFPGALDASQWAQARDELRRWRTARETMKAKLAAAEEARLKAAAEAGSDQPVEVVDETETETET